MNNILDNLFYKEKLGISNKTTFIKNVREKLAPSWCDPEWGFDRVSACAGQCAAGGI